MTGHDHFVMMKTAEDRLEEVIDAITVEQRHLIGRFPTPSLRVCNEVLEFYTRHSPWFALLNLAEFNHLLSLVVSHPDCWRDEARGMFRPTPRKMTVPPVRRIQPLKKPTIIHGRFEHNVHILVPQSVDLVFTSPPYAMQRRESYGGIPEHIYPDWTSRWMAEVRKVLKPEGSVLINVRPHVADGRTVSYVRHTIDWLEQDGWNYCDELFWIKVDAPPLGHRERPRRAVESLHWFSLSKTPYCDPKSGGNASKRLGLSGSKGFGGNIHAAAASPYRSGTARRPDYIVANVSSVDRSEYNTHPAQYPVNLVRPYIQMFCPKAGMVVDPFIGSGTTAIAAMLEHRNCIGFEKEGGYVNIARKRIKEFIDKKR